MMSQPHNYTLYIREEMRDRMKRLELEQRLEEAVLRIAKQGEPMDPEMLNPARKRPILQVIIISYIALS